MTELNDLTQPASNRVFIKDDRILVINDFEIKDLQVVELIKAKIENGEDSEMIDAMEGWDSDQDGENRENKDGQEAAKEGGASKKKEEPATKINAA